MLIYRIIRKATQETVYVGQAVDGAKRWKRHCREARNGRDMAICQAINKYGSLAFEFVEVFYSDSQEEIDREEIRLIAAEHPRYNRAPGGLNNILGKGQKPWNSGKVGIYSEETRKAMGAHSIGRSPPNKGAPHNDQTKALIKAKRKEQKMSNNKPFKHLQTGEIFNTLAEAEEKLGVSQSHISQVLSGVRPHAECQTFSYEFSAALEPEAENKRRQRKLLHVETGTVYGNASEASKVLGIGSTQILRVAKGERKHTRGQHFTFVE